MTKPKPWPRDAYYAREDAIMEASRALQNIQAILDNRVTREELLLVLTRTTCSLHKIVTVLKSVPASPAEQD